MKAISDQPGAFRIADIQVRAPAAGPDLVRHVLKGLKAQGRVRVWDAGGTLSGAGSASGTRQHQRNWVITRLRDRGLCITTDTGEKGLESPLVADMTGGPARAQAGGRF